MISKLADISSKSKIAASATIESFSKIYENVEIGEGTWIGPNVTIFPDTKIGANCKIYPGAIIGAVSQDLKYKGEPCRVEIGDNTTIRECVTIHKATTDKMVTKVGANCLLMAYVHIAHDVWVGDNCIIANSSALAGHVEVENDVVIEGMVGIQQFVKIGAFSFVAGMTGVRKSVPPFIKAAREPLSFVGVNTIGLRRRGLDVEDIKRIEDIYRVLFVQSQNMSRGIEEVVSLYPDCPFQKRIVSFIKSEEKGIIKGYQS